MKKYLIISIIILMITSCSTYFEKSIETRAAIQNYEYQDALNNIAHSKFLKKKRNSLLYHLELGRLFHLQGQYTESNKHLNFADDLMDYDNSIGNFAVSAVVNSAAQKYTAEDFEKILIHYYKALNYSYLNQTEDALVEARRMNLKQMELGEKGQKKYNKDPFGHLLMGQIYERANQFNNAFIAYRNAYNAFIEDESKLGVSVPSQLKYDILSMAQASGLYSELNRYENEFNIKYDYNEKEFGEVILFWENGQAPHKVEKNYIFSLVGGVGGFYFVDDEQSMSIPFVGNLSNPNVVNSLTAIRIAMPKYVETPAFYNPELASIKVNDIASQKSLEPIENINEVARITLKERFAKDLGKHLTKLAINKIAQQALKNDSTTAILGMVLEGVGFISERADTRNWQSLPGKINYTRIPLTKADTNIITLELINQFNQKETIKIPVVSKGNQIQFKNVFTPDKLPLNFSLEKQIADSITLNTISP